VSQRWQCRIPCVPTGKTSTIMEKTPNVAREYPKILDMFQMLGLTEIAHPQFQCNTIILPTKIAICWEWVNSKPQVLDNTKTHLVCLLATNKSISKYHYIDISIYRYINISICQYINLLIYQYVNISICQYVNISIYQYITMYLYLISSYLSSSHLISPHLSYPIPLFLPIYI